MKKILEVLQCEDGHLRFNTDLDVQKDPMAIMDLTVSAMFRMATRLWGGNEQTVIAVIRSLFVADSRTTASARNAPNVHKRFRKSLE